MSKPILAVAGDLHISGTIYRSRLLDMKGDAHYAVAQIADFCAEQRLDLILAGDVLDTKRPQSADVKALQNAVTIITKAGCDVFGIQGQHDMSEPPWVEVVGARQLTLTPQKVPEGTGPSLSVVGLDYMPRGELLEQLAEVPPCDILVLHGMMKESLGYVVEEADGDDGLREVGPNYDFAMGELPTHLKLILAGDNHNAYSCEDIEGVPNFSYTGSTHMRSTDENPGKHFLVIHDDCSVHRVNLDTRPFRKYEVVSEERLRDCLTDIRELVEAGSPDSRPEEVRKPFVLVRFDRSVERVRERVETACEDKVFVKMLPYQTVAQIGEETPVVEGSVTLEGCLDEVINPDEQPELNAFVRELLAAEDPMLPIAKAKDRFLQDTPTAEVANGVD